MLKWMPNEVDKIQLEFWKSEIGKEVLYSGNYGTAEPKHAVLDKVGFDKHEGRIVVGVILDNGDKYWGYTHQINFV